MSSFVRTFYAIGKSEVVFIYDDFIFPIFLNLEKIMKIEKLKKIIKTEKLKRKEK